MGPGTLDATTLSVVQVIRRSPREQGQGGILSLALSVALSLLSEATSVWWLPALPAKKQDSELPRAWLLFLYSP